MDTMFVCECVCVCTCIDNIRFGVFDVLFIITVKLGTHEKMKKQIRHTVNLFLSSRWAPGRPDGDVQEDAQSFFCEVADFMSEALQAAHRRSSSSGLSSLRSTLAAALAN